MQVLVGDRVRIRGLIHSDCIGLIGTVVEVLPSALFPRARRCRVDFGGRVRRIIDTHLVRVEKSSAAFTRPAA
jgi:hypothetical protein